MASMQALHGVLRKFGLEQFHITYEAYYVNHLLDAVVALHQLGASHRQLTDYAEKLAKQYKPAVAPEGDLTGNEWKSLIGKRQRLTDLCNFFRAEVKSRGVRGAIGHYLPGLLDGAIGCAAFHPIIHVGYGLIGESGEDVGDGLAYIVFEHRPPHPEQRDATIQHVVNASDSPLPAWAPPKTTAAEGIQATPVCQLALKLRQDARLQRLLPLLHERVDSRIDELVAETGLSGFRHRTFLVQDNVISIINGHLDSSGLFDGVTTDARLQELSHAVVQGALLVYASSEEPDDFFLLHGLTSAFALRQVLPQLPEFEDRLKAVRLFCRDLLFAYVVRDMPDLVTWQPTDATALPSWDEIKEKTVGVDSDEHLIKVVFTCLRLEEEFGTSLLGYEMYRAVAAYKTGFLPWPRQ